MPSAPQSPSLVFQTLDKLHNRNAFSCGNDSLDRYLKERANQDARRNFAAPFVLVDAAEPRIILGYYTLSAFSVVLDDLPQELTSKLPPYPNIPATLLGRLAVNLELQGRGLGQFLLMDALRRALRFSLHIGSFAVFVDAIDENAINFYKKNGFLPLPTRPDRLFLPMKTISDLFQEP